MSQRCWEREQRYFGNEPRRAAVAASPRALDLPPPCWLCGQTLDRIEIGHGEHARTILACRRCDEAQYRTGSEPEDSA